RGLGPLDTAMNVAIPEFDGRVITVPISFKEEAASGSMGATPTDAVSVGHEHRSPLPLGEGQGEGLPHDPLSESGGRYPASQTIGNPAAPAGRELGAPVIRYVPDPERIRRLVSLARRFS